MGTLRGYVVEQCNWCPISPYSFMKANILIDEHGNARLADFGLLVFVSDPTNPTVSSSYTPAGTTRWMSPELLDPDRFGPKDGRPTKESDSYALGMVIYEVLSGEFPFASYREYVVMRKVIEGERPERPQGAEGEWFTDYLWHTLQLCWAQEPKGRPTIEAILECLGPVPEGWKPSFPGTDLGTHDPPQAVISYSPTLSSSDGVGSVTSAFAAQHLQSHYQPPPMQTPSPPSVLQPQARPEIAREQAIETLEGIELANLLTQSDLASDTGILGRLDWPPGGSRIPFRGDVRPSVDVFSHQWNQGVGPTKAPSLRRPLSPPFPPSPPDHSRPHSPIYPDIVNPQPLYPGPATPPVTPVPQSVLRSPSPSSPRTRRGTTSPAVPVYMIPVPPPVYEPMAGFPLPMDNSHDYSTLSDSRTPNIVPPGADPSLVDFREFYPYIPNEIERLKRITQAQLEVLEQTFSRDAKPNGLVRAKLARQLDMTPKSVHVSLPTFPSVFTSNLSNAYITVNSQIWFQNRCALASYPLIPPPFPPPLILI